MFSLLVEVCKHAVDVFLRNKRNKRDKKIEIAIILDGISELLIDTANKLEKDEYPHENCVIMGRLADQLNKNLSPFMTEEEVQRLHQCLSEVVFIENQYALRHQKDTLPSIRRAAGEFRAMALLLKF